MHTTKIWLYETCSFGELSTESKKTALENIDKIVREEVGGFVSVYREFLEVRAKGYKFLKSGKIFKEKEESKK